MSDKWESKRALLSAAFGPVYDRDWNVGDSHLFRYFGGIPQEQQVVTDDLADYIMKFDICTCPRDAALRRFRVPFRWVDALPEGAKVIRHTFARWNDAPEGIVTSRGPKGAVVDGELWLARW